MSEGELKAIERDVKHLKVQMVSQQRAMVKAVRLIAQLLDRVGALEVRK